MLDLTECKHAAYANLEEDQVCEPDSCIEHNWRVVHSDPLVLDVVALCDLVLQLCQAEEDNQDTIDHQNTDHVLHKASVRVGGLTEDLVVWSVIPVKVLSELVHYVWIIAKEVEPGHVQERL